MAVASPIPDEPPRISAQRSRSSVIGMGLLGHTVVECVRERPESSRGSTVVRSVRCSRADGCVDPARLLTARMPEFGRFGVFVRVIRPVDGRPRGRLSWTSMNDGTLVLLLLPVIVIELGLMIFALRDLTQPGAPGPRRQQADVGAHHHASSGRSARSSTSPSGARTGERRRRRLSRADQAVRRRDDGVLAVDGLDLDVPAGSVFGLLGPNGAGKTTTLRLLTGLARPTGGRGPIDGVAVDPRRPDGARAAIGVLDQDPRYYGWMTGRELVELAAAAGPRRRRRAGARRRDVLEQVGLADAADRRIGGVLGRDAPAARDRPGARRRAGPAHPRRAGQLARPGGPARPARAHRRPARQRDRHLLDPRPRRRRADLRPGRRSWTAAGS